MGAVTYPDSQVAGFLNDHFVPVQVDFEKAAKLADRLQVFWTPNLNMINGREARFYHLIGWLPPSEFMAMLQIALGHHFLGRKRYFEAAPAFADVFDKYPRSGFAPEALYFKGVCRYLSSHSVDELKEEWVTLQRFYPDSEWAMKSNV